MRLTKLHIKNFRGIEDLEVNLIDRFTVIVGENGAGKTSILDAVANLISVIGGSFQMPVDNPDGAEVKLFRAFHKNDIRVKIHPDYKRNILPLEIKAHAIIEDKAVEWTRMYIKRGGTIRDTQKGEALIVGQETIDNNHIIPGDIQKFSQKYYDSGENTQLPLLAYYGTGRLWLNGEKTEYKQRGYRIDGYHNALNPKISNKTFLSWYKTYEDEILKFKKDDSLLRAFKKAITTCVEEWSDIGFSFLDDDLKGLLTPENGEPYWMLFGMLSDGYRNLIGMVADMAYRCITLNPQLKENAIIEAEGVVLIDEVGLHLHPKWQRKVVDDLKRAFPKIQFIATTHSPFVVQSLTSSELFNLDRISDVNPSDLTVEEVTLNLMGVPSKFGEENAKQEELSKEYLLKVNDLQKSNGSADEILKELEKMEYEISNPAVRAFLKMKKLQYTK